MNRQPVLHFRSERTAGHRIGYFIGMFLVDLFRAWVLMLFLGAVHHDYWPQVPAIGYVAAFAVVMVYDIFVTAPTSEAVRRGMNEAG